MNLFIPWCAKLCQNIAEVIGGNYLCASFPFNVPGLVLVFIFFFLMGKTLDLSYPVYKSCWKLSFNAMRSLELLEQFSLQSRKGRK